MTIQEAQQQLLFQLFHVYDEREARNIADLVMEHVTEWKRIDRIINKTVPLSSVKEKELAERENILHLREQDVSAFMTKKEFDLVRSCLHPDRPRCCQASMCRCARKRRN